VEHYQGNRSLPVYEHRKKGYCKEQIAEILYDPSLDNKFICSIHPVLVEHNASFVLDLSKLKDRNDVGADDLGTWKCSGSRILTFFIKCHRNGCSVYQSKSRGAIVNIR